MTRTETTKFLGKLLTDTRLGGAGSHWASEVSIDPWTPKARRVDYMEFSPANQCSVSGIEKGIFTCYEIKSCKEDVYSGNGLNFFGKELHCNYDGVLQRHSARFPEWQIC